MAMNFYTYGMVIMQLLLFTGVALPEYSYRRSSSAEMNANSQTQSVLVALLDSHYTELAELIEKALLLLALEEAVAKQNITIFAPINDAFGRHLDAEFKSFLLEPRSTKSLQILLLFHFVPSRIRSNELPGHDQAEPAHYKTLADNSNEFLHVNHAKVVHPDSITRPDGIIHGISQLLVPQSVQDDFNRGRNLRFITVVEPEGEPEVDPRTKLSNKLVFTFKPGSPPVLHMSDAMAPGLARVSGPDGHYQHFDRPTQAKDFIKTLKQYGGYNEVADVLVNLTSIATEVGKLVREGYYLTILAPNDEAMAKLTSDQLSEPGAPEQIMYYHMVAEYQTEESMYNALRIFGNAKYDSLRVPHKVVAEEADGSVKFGNSKGASYLLDPDIYTDGRISVQGIDGVLFPVEEETMELNKAKVAVKVVAVKPARRGKLLEAG